MRIFKLTNVGMQTFNGCQWELGVKKEVSGEESLCGDGWLHAYEDALLAVLHDPIHGHYLLSPGVKLFEGDGGRKILRDGQIKIGVSDRRTS